MPRSPRFTESGPFTSFLETIGIEWDTDADALALVCQECSENLCEVEADDTLAVLVRVALAHDLTCEARDA